MYIWLEDIAFREQYPDNMIPKSEGLMKKSSRSMLQLWNSTDIHKSQNTPRNMSM